MTVDELWQNVISSLGKSTTPDTQLRRALSDLIGTADGRAMLIRGLHQNLSAKNRLLRQLTLVMEPSGAANSALSEGDRRDLLKRGAKAARGLKEEDASYWIFLWLRLKAGAGIAAEAAGELKDLIIERGARPEDAVDRFKKLQGWGEYPREQWIDLIETAPRADKSAEFQSRLRPILEFLRTGGEPFPSLQSARTVAKPVQGNTPRGAEPPLPVAATTTAPTAAKPVQGTPPRAPDPVQSVPAAVTTTAVKPAQGTPPRALEPTIPAVTATATAAKPVQEPLPQSIEPTVAVAVTATEKPAQGHQPRAPEPPVPVVVTRRPESQPGGEVVPPASDTAGPAPVEVRQEASQVKEPRPKRPTPPRKTTAKERAVESPQPDPSNSDGPTKASDSRAAKLSGGARALAEPQQPVVGQELPEALAELTSAVRAISGRLDQIASWTGDGSFLEQRLVELERRLAGVERVLGETQSDSQRVSGDIERLRVRIREQEHELLDARRERDASTARAEELARRLVAADARINAAESRADQNIHEAFRERDAAILTFKARLWDAVQAQLSDVTDPTPGEQFASTEEEVLTTRLRRIRDTLRAEGVPP